MPMNWMTTIAGLIPIAAGVIDAVGQLVTLHYTGNLWQDLGLLGSGLIGILAKDFNTTGAGTTATKK